MRNVDELAAKICSRMTLRDDAKSSGQKPLAVFDHGYMARESITEKST